jgi:hypothetical protein
VFSAPVNEARASLDDRLGHWREISGKMEGLIGEEMERLTSPEGMTLNAQTSRETMCKEIKRLGEIPGSSSASFQQRGMMHLIGDEEAGKKSIHKTAWIWIGNPKPWHDPLFAQYETAAAKEPEERLRKLFKHQALMGRTPQQPSALNDKYVMRLVTSLEGHKPTAHEIRSGQ